MYLLAIVIDLLAVFVAGTFGSMLRCKIPVYWKRVMAQCIGLVAVCLGGWGVLRQITDVKAARPEVEGSLLVVLALLLGCVLGCALPLPRLMTRLATTLGGWFDGDRDRNRDRNRNSQKKNADRAATEDLSPADRLSETVTYAEAPTGQTGDRFAEGFVLATMLVCSGALFVSGLLEGNMTMLYIKVGIDALFVFALAMLYGDGASLSALPLAAANGLLYVFHAGGKAFVSSRLFGLISNADKLNDAVTQWNTNVIAQVSVLASVILLVTGVVMVSEKKFKVTRLLPAYVILYAYQWIVPVITAAVS